MKKRIFTLLTAVVLVLGFGGSDFSVRSATEEATVPIQAYFPDGSMKMIDVSETAFNKDIIGYPLPVPPNRPFDVHTFNGMGADEDCVVITIMGDGFTSEEQYEFLEAASATTESLLNTYPFNLFADKINVYAVAVVSRESGVAKDPLTSSRTNVDNYFGSSFWFDGITERLLYISNGNRVDELLKACGIVSDLNVILANSETYGGGGGAYSVCSLNPSVSEVTAHEIGHVFGLADEYWWRGYEAPNMTHGSNLNNLKWQPWVGVENIGTYPFAEDTNWYHPNEMYDSRNCSTGICSVHVGNHCKMDALNYPFCNVCASELTRRLSNIVKADFHGFAGDLQTNLSSPLSNNAKRIVDYAFWGRDDLTNLIIPDNVTSIGRYSFLRCNGLTNLTIPESVTRIDDTAFFECENLKIYGLLGSEAAGYAYRNKTLFALSEIRSKDIKLLKELALGNVNNETPGADIDNNDTVDVIDIMLAKKQLLNQ